MSSVTSDPLNTIVEISIVLLGFALFYIVMKRTHSI